MSYDKEFIEKFKILTCYDCKYYRQFYVKEGDNFAEHFGGFYDKYFCCVHAPPSQSIDDIGRY